MHRENSDTKSGFLWLEITLEIMEDLSPILYKQLELWVGGE